MNAKEFKNALLEIENNLMRLSSNAIYDKWNVSTKSLTKILVAIDKLKEARMET